VSFCFALFLFLLQLYKLKTHTHQNSIFLPPNLSFTIKFHPFISLSLSHFLYSRDPKMEPIHERNTGVPREHIASLIWKESLMRLVLVLFPFFVVFFVPLDHVSSESISRANFPDGFVFGTASSAYQVTFFFFFIFSKLIQQRKNEDFDNRNIFLQEISSKEL